ncbi:redoxin domain-containing protein [Halostella litorea]|uniref:redoxin domain-containing protein n=1 Tax=Halostella litorea TaxID=2528831 RepID=UPI0021752151|nr:redoxin domain-containing protein [Halostella litorea]
MLCHHVLEEGSSAPRFSLPGCIDGEMADFSLDETLARDRVALLVFFPFDFSPVCTNELCAIRDAEWFQLTPEIDVWAISGDSVYAHRTFAEKYDFNFPLLSDCAGRVAESYDVCYEEWESHERIPQRAVFVVDSDRTIRYAWATEDAFEKPDFFPVKQSLDAIAAERDQFGPRNVELTVEYGEGPDQFSS